MKSFTVFRLNQLPVRKSGMDTKKPTIAQTRVNAAPFKYLLVLKNEKLVLRSRFWQTLKIGLLV